MVPPGAPHTFANLSDDATMLLNTFTPDLYVQYFRDLSNSFASGSNVGAAEIVQIMGRYETTPATDF